MSTDYLPSQPIPFDKVKGMKCEVREKLTDDATPNSAYLTDGANYLWAYGASNGGTQFSRFGGNNVDEIQEHLAKKFKVAFVSEYDPGFDELARGYDYIKIQFGS